MSLAVKSMIAVMRERGFADADILAVIEAGVGDEQRSPAAERQARYRIRKAEAARSDVTSDVTNNVTRDVTESPQVSPKDNIKPLPSPQSSLRSVNIRAREVFDRFWPVYPKRVNRKAALAKLETVLKAGIDPEKIILGAARYAEHVKFTEPQFIKAPDAWLNAGKWDDELPASAPKPKAREGPRSSGNGWANLYNDLKGRAHDEQSANNIKDITPAASESGTGDPNPHVHEPPRGSSGGGKILDFGSAGSDARRPPAASSEAARNFDWHEPVWGNGRGSFTD